jgi:hypothetical protein
MMLRWPPPLALLQRWHCSNSGIAPTLALLQLWRCSHWKKMDAAHRAIKYAKMKEEVDLAEAQFETESLALEKSCVTSIRPLLIRNVVCGYANCAVS